LERSKVTHDRRTFHRLNRRLGGDDDDPARPARHPARPALEETLSLDGVGDDEDRHVGGRLHFEFPGQVVEGARPLLGVASQVKRLPERRSVEEVHASPFESLGAEDMHRDSKSLPAEQDQRPDQPEGCGEGVTEVEAGPIAGAQATSRSRAPACPPPTTSRPYR
jgi:hypothetical protein